MQQAEIIALACSDPPEGRERWALELLTSESRKLQGLEAVSRESIRLFFKLIAMPHNRQTVN